MRYYLGIEFKGSNIMNLVHVTRFSGGLSAAKEPSDATVFGSAGEAKDTFYYFKNSYPVEFGERVVRAAIFDENLTNIGALSF